MSFALVVDVCRFGPSRLLKRAPRAAWGCALVALASGLSWSFITPPFQVPDENAHYAYVQQLAERGTLPHQVDPEGSLSPREDATLAALLTFGVAEHKDNPAPFTEAQQQVIERASDRSLSASGSGDALTATANPPLYYLLQVAPYKLAFSAKVLDKLALMRCLSALMGALTVLLVFAFLRELLPASRWAWPAGALLVAFQPLFGFMSGGLNNDDLMYAAAAGVLWSIARAFRLGLTPARGALIGGWLGVGLLSKLTLLGFVPAVALALALLARRAWGAGRRGALRGLAWAVGLSLGPVVVYVLLNRFLWRRDAIPGGIGAVAGGGTRRFAFSEELSHIWQLFLPHLWMRPQFAYTPLWDTWFKGLVGRFGWLDYFFPAWVYKLAAVVVLLVCGLASRELLRCRLALRRRLAELSVYALAVAGLCIEIGVESYREAVGSGGTFEQARYLLPLLCLYAAIAVLAVRAGGRRWGPIVGACLVVLAIGHDLFAQAITISRYYT